VAALLEEEQRDVAPKATAAAAKRVSGTVTSAAADATLFAMTSRLDVMAAGATIDRTGPGQPTRRRANAWFSIARVDGLLPKLQISG
jgi:hypothetical protein